MSSFLYCDLDGNPVGHKERRDLVDTDGNRDKKFTWTRPSGADGLNGGRPLLYRAERLKVAPPDCPIDIVEGEKCVQALEDAAMFAVCGPYGATDKGNEHWSEVAQLFRGRSVRLWPDNHDTGRAHMEAAAMALAGIAADVRWVELSGVPDKGDVADYLAAGHTPESLWSIAYHAPAWRQHGTFDTAELLAEDIPPMRWVIPRFLPEGATIFGGKGKIGKSLAAIQMAIAVAGGRQIFGVTARQGDVLYVALEDPKWRLQERVRTILQGEPPPGNLEWRMSCPRVGEGAAELIETWLRLHSGAALVVVDILKAIRPPQGGGRAYDEDYNAIAPLAELARSYRVAILIIHHLRKAEADDVMDTLNGSSGLSAVVDGAIIMQRVRGQADATVDVISKDGDVPQLALSFDETTLTWSLLGEAREYALSKERAAVVDILREHGPLPPKDIAELLGRNRSTIRNLLRKMVSAAEITQSGQHYALPDGAPSLKDGDLSAPVAGPDSMADSQIPLIQAQYEAPVPAVAAVAGAVA